MVIPLDFYLFVKKIDATNTTLTSKVLKVGKYVSEYEIGDEIIASKYKKFVLEGEEIYSVPYKKILIKNMIPNKGNIVIQFDDKITTTDTGLIIPESAQDAVNTGTILFTYEGCQNFAKGDKVLLGKSQGLDFKYNGEQVHIVQEGFIIAKL